MSDSFFGPEPLNFDQKLWVGRLTFVELKSGARVRGDLSGELDTGGEGEVWGCIWDGIEGREGLRWGVQHGDDRYR